MKTWPLAICIVLSPTLTFTQEAPIELQHIDVSNVDTSANPCEDFYQYTCGKLNAANPIPPDEIFWGVAGELQKWNDQVLRDILEKNKAPNASRTPNEQKIGDFYASCVEQETEKKDDFPIL